MYKPRLSGHEQERVTTDLKSDRTQGFIDVDESSCCPRGLLATPRLRIRKCFSGNSLFASGSWFFFEFDYGYVRGTKNSGKPRQSMVCWQKSRFTTALTVNS